MKTTINMNSPANASEARTLGRARRLMKQADNQAEALKAHDNGNNDLNPSENAVAIDGVRLSDGGRTSGVAEFDSTGLTRMDTERNHRVELEVDHMMWGTYNATTTSRVEKDGRTSHYSIQDSVDGYLTNQYNIAVDHQSGLLTFESDHKAERYYNRSRGLS